VMVRRFHYHARKFSLGEVASDGSWQSSEKRSCIFAIHFGLQIEALQYNYGKELAMDA